MNYEAPIAGLEDTLKERDARIRELTGERDARRALFAEISEQMEDMNAAFDRWIKAFDTEINERGEHHWREPLMQKYDELVAEHRRLFRGWNKFVPQYNAAAAPRRRKSRGAHAASSDQKGNVIKRRKAGHPLRTTANHTGPTDMAGGVDRATLAKLERIFPDRLVAAHERANKRSRDGPPRHIADL